MNAPSGHFRRYGRFKVSAQLAREFDSVLKRIMGMCIVIRAEHIFSDDSIEYMALSEHFRVVDRGGEAPWYRWVCTTEGDVRAEAFTLWPPSSAPNEAEVLR